MYFLSSNLNIKQMTHALYLYNNKSTPVNVFGNVFFYRYQVCNKSRGTRIKVHGTYPRFVQFQLNFDNIPKNISIDRFSNHILSDGKNMKIF